jgi:hypothetical protein
MPRMLALATVVLTLTGGAASAAPSARPALKVSAGAVKGTHFRARERIRVVFRLESDRIVRHLRTTKAGTFRTALPSFDPCLESLQITAVGAPNETAALKLPQRACPPA